ncbi:MAG: NAD-glutamate dehydrogenase [Parachlamydiaceae bacterium]|nr:NAD-glutamate dehydrogenase [Parachlamydiaceae bacterium]
MSQHEKLNLQLQREGEKFKECYLWLESAMPATFCEEQGQANMMLLTHSLIELERQEYVANIQLKDSAFILCLDQTDADLQVLKNYAHQAITSYQTYVSKTPPPFLNADLHLRIIIIHFFRSDKNLSTTYSEHDKKALKGYIQKNHPDIDEHDFDNALVGMSPEFLKSQSFESLVIAIRMFIRATTRDHCQYEVHYNEEWENKNQASMKLTIAWRNTPKHNFLYRIVRTVHRHGLVVQQLSASYPNPYGINSILALTLDLHGENDQPAWDVVNMLEFIKDLITIKYFASFDNIDHHLVQKGIISNNMGNLLRAMMNFIHQSLVHIDTNLYTLEHIEDGLCRHPELTALLCQAFKYRFDPEQQDKEKYQTTCNMLLLDIEKLDTGHEENDVRRKTILLQGLNFIHHTLKTNFYRPNYTSLSFRLDPLYLDNIPFDRSKKFPELPFAIFFIKGMHFLGFHIRFRDLARGGLRTVYPEHIERMIIERNHAFTECYNLALTQHMKNKDIPEGGAKGIIFLKPFERLESEAAIYKRDLQLSKLDSESIDQKLEIFRQEQRLEHLYQAQRSFIESLITLVNCEPDGKLRARGIVDYWKKPEYLYLGPDELMHDVMIEWIAQYSKSRNYKPGSSFISGKPKLGINHKEYGVTSLGLNVYVDAVLRYLNIDPTRDTFTVKMSGGPDGDVAGNEIRNLHRFYPNTAKLIALTDVSGTIFEPQGLDLQVLVQLFLQERSIRFYPPQKLTEGGFLVDKFTKRHQTTLVQQTLCWRKQNGKLEQDWLTGNEMHHLLRHNVHRTSADIFIPAGGRPRTLNETNYEEFLDATGKPTAKAIVEGANLYVSPKARRELEKRGALIIKDSSANKTGVICSSFEVLCGLTLGDERFLEYKPALVEEILERLRECAANEADLLLRTRRETEESLTEISDQISQRINLFTDQLLEYLEHVDLVDSSKDFLTHSFFNYCLSTLSQQFRNELMQEIPDSHKKAIIACHIAAKLVYERGLTWSPSIVDILPMLKGKR